MARLIGSMTDRWTPFHCHCVIQLLHHLKEKGLHGRVDEGVAKKAKAVKSEGEHDHIVVPEQLDSGRWFSQMLTFI